MGGGWANLHSQSEREHLLRWNSRHTSNWSHRESFTLSMLFRLTFTTAIVGCVQLSANPIGSTLVDLGRYWRRLSSAQLSARLLAEGFRPSKSLVVAGCLVAETGGGGGGAGGGASGSNRALSTDCPLYASRKCRLEVRPTGCGD